MYAVGAMIARNFNINSVTVYLQTFFAYNLTSKPGWIIVRGLPIAPSPVPITSLKFTLFTFVPTDPGKNCTATEMVEKLAQLNKMKGVVVRQMVIAGSQPDPSWSQGSPFDSNPEGLS